MRAVFVFGSNRQGRHGKGAALEARRFHGAAYGQAEGIQGNSYAIVTKELRHWMPPVTLNEVAIGVIMFIAFARMNKDMVFNVSPIGCGLAGFTPDQIGPMFKYIPDNVNLPPEFKPYSL